MEWLGENGWNDDECLIIFCVVLLYDVGYGFYLYIFEYIFDINYEVIMV